MNSFQQPAEPLEKNANETSRVPFTDDLANWAILLFRQNATIGPHGTHGNICIAKAISIATKRFEAVVIQSQDWPDELKVIECPKRKTDGAKAE